VSGTVTTPPYAAFSNAILSDQEKADIREFCGYPLYGNGTVVFPAPWINVYYLALETRMNTAQPVEYQKMRYYLAQLYPLDSAIVAASANLDTDVAAVWKHNVREVRDRTRLFDQYRRRLLQFMGIPAGPGLEGSDSGNIRLVV
jgi:hypothetical protein